MAEIEKDLAIPYKPNLTRENNSREDILKNLYVMILYWYLSLYCHKHFLLWQI